MPAYGTQAEIHPAVHQRIVASTANIAALRAKVSELDKLHEVAKETLTQLINNREDDISQIGTQAETKAEKSKVPELLSHFQKTIAYKAQIAEKGLETRRKNEEAKAKAGEGGGEGGGG